MLVLTAFDLWVSVAVAAVLAYLFFRYVRRRSDMREFASSRGWRVRGVIPSDKYEPYKRFSNVRKSVLLHHVIEGRVNGREVSCFDFPIMTGLGTTTGAIACVPHCDTQVQIVPFEERRAVALQLATTALGPRTAAAIQSGTAVILETQVNYLFAQQGRRIPANELPEFVAFVSALADAVDSDALARSDTK